MISAASVFVLKLSALRGVKELIVICKYAGLINPQKRISDFLDKKCSQIERVISIKQEKIEKLQEYKKSLIYEYVTGKKEVS